MFKQFLFAALATTMLFACGTDSAQDTAQAEDSTDTEAVKMESFGESITPDNALSYSELMAKMAQSEQDSMDVKFAGTVQEVCQVKGCWMTITSDEEGAEPIMVRFKDYGFFMPKDIAGRKVIMEGKAFAEETSVEDLRHYAMDAGKSEEEIQAITDPKKEAKFLASGVLLVEE